VLQTYRNSGEHGKCMDKKIHWTPTVRPESWRPKKRGDFGEVLTR